ncbi:MAG: hypothetical protein ACLP1Y_07730 [Candidatus Acidiferrales bacterium]
MSIPMMRIRKAVPIVWLAATAGLFICVAGTVVPQSAHPNSEKVSSYFPLSVGNRWSYVLERHSKIAGTLIWRVTQREIIDGIPVYHLWPTPAQGDEPLSLSEVQGGVVEAHTERFLLKNPLHSGDLWSVRSDTPRAIGKLDAFEIVSAGKACSVGQRSFDDCATIREDDEANNVTSFTTYARGVGPVKYVYFRGLHSREVDTILTIKSWEVH